MIDLRTSTSNHSYAETVERLVAAIAEAGATLFATVDQSGAARSAGLELRPTTLLVFGNPKGGTLVMEAFPLAALDLPLKLLVWEERGAVSVAYAPASVLAERYAVTGLDGVVAAMDALLAKVVAAVR